MSPAVILAIIGIAFLVWYFMNKSKPNLEEVQERDGLKFTISGEKTVNPPEKTSEYRTEYALGDFLGDNVDFTITLNTLSGWEENGINQIKIYRRTPGSSVDISDPITIDGIANFTTTTIKIFGSSLTADAVGDAGGTNKLILEALNKDGVVKAGDPVDAGGLVSTDVTITKEDLNYKLSDSMSTPFVFKIGAQDLVTSAEISKDKFKLRGFDDLGEFSLEPGAASGSWSFKLADGTYLSVEGITSFQMIKDDQKVRFQGQGTNKILTFPGYTPQKSTLTLKTQGELTNEMSVNSKFVILRKSLSPSRKYPPTPYTADVATARTNTNWLKTVNWNVSGADYGNGDYTANINQHFAHGANHAGSAYFDVEGLVDGHFSAVPESLGLYHGATDGSENVFSLALPVAIHLNGVRMSSRHVEAPYYDSPDTYRIYGVTSDDVEELLVDSAQSGMLTTVTELPAFLPVDIAIPLEKQNKTYQTFRIKFNGKSGRYPVIGEFEFWGQEDNTWVPFSKFSPGTYRMYNKHHYDAYNKYCSRYTWSGANGVDGTSKETIACDVLLGSDGYEEKLKWNITESNGGFNLKALASDSKFCSSVDNPETVQNEISCDADSAGDAETFMIDNHPNYEGFYKVTNKNRGLCWFNPNGVISCEPNSRPVRVPGESPSPNSNQSILESPKTAFKFEKL